MKETEKDENDRECCTLINADERMSGRLKEGTHAGIKDVFSGHMLTCTSASLKAQHTVSLQNQI